MNQALDVVESFDSMRASTKPVGTTSILNLFILGLGLTCVAIGYVLSNLSPEQLAEWVGKTNVSIQRPAVPTS